MSEPSGPDDGAARASITRLLQSVAAGIPNATDALFEGVYAELQRMARLQMAGERDDHTLQATALVHEAWLRLAGPEAAFANRAHFFTAAARAMRQILIEHARRRGRIKRDGGKRAPPESLLELAAREDPEEVQAIDEAIEALRAEDARTASVVDLRFFAGLSLEATAEALELSPRTVVREWEYGRAWLFRRLDDRAT